jgi:hypothetical protein
MHEVLYAMRRSDPGHTLCSIGLDGVKVVFARAIKRANTVHDSVRSACDRFDRRIITNVAEHWLNLPNGTIGTHMQGFVRTAHGHSNTPAFHSELLRYIAPNKSRTAKNGDKL